MITFVSNKISTFALRFFKDNEITFKRYKLYLRGAL